MGDIYRVTSLHGDGFHCTLYNETTDESANPNYPIRHFDEEKKWTKIVPLRECPNCKEEREIPSGDYLCLDCREIAAIEGRLVILINGSPSIAQFSGTHKDIALVTTDQTSIAIQYEDLTMPVLKALKRFLDK